MIFVGLVVGLLSCLLHFFDGAFVGTFVGFAVGRCVLGLFLEGGGVGAAEGINVGAWVWVMHFSV